MKTLVLNPGSESLKGALFENKKKIAEFRIKKSKYSFNDALKLIPKLSGDMKIGIRIVHGGKFFSKPTLIGKKEIKKLEELSTLAPLHNKPALKIIKEIKKLFSKVRIYGVFDTAFHSTLPEYASTYAIPRELSKKFHIKKYGFHGIACQNILRQIKKKEGKLLGKIIVCHLGGGASVTAIRNGKSVDTSMGFTPLEGLMMMTRAGDLDDGVVNFLAHKLKQKPDQILEILNKKSGVYGLTGEKNFAKVVQKAKKGDKWCKLAIEIFIYRIVKRVFAYYGVLQGLDALVFSGGIGAGSAYVRKKICKALSILDIHKTFVIRVDEEEEIFRQI